MIGTTTTVKVLAAVFTAGLLFFAVKGPEPTSSSKAQSYNTKNIRLDDECLSKLRDTAFVKSGEVLAKINVKH